MFRNTMPRYEILSADAIGVLDRGWRRIVSEIGVQFAKPEAVELFRQAGQKVDGEVVFLDPEFVLEQVAKAPREFDLQARNPANSVHIGGDQHGVRRGLRLAVRPRGRRPAGRDAGRLPPAVHAVPVVPRSWTRPAG